MYGWTVHDGGVELEDQIEPEDDTYMSNEEYDLFWNRFVGFNTEDQREEHGFESYEFNWYGDHSPEYMATLDVITTSMYECGVFSMVTPEGENPDLYAYLFDDRTSKSMRRGTLVEHSFDLNYIGLEETEEWGFTAEVRQLWTNFAKFKNPNGEDVYCDDWEWWCWSPTTQENFEVYEISRDAGMVDAF